MYKRGSLHIEKRQYSVKKISSLCIEKRQFMYRKEVVYAQKKKRRYSDPANEVLCSRGLPSAVIRWPYFCAPNLIPVSLGAQPCKGETSIIHRNSSKIDSFESFHSFQHIPHLSCKFEHFRRKKIKSFQRRSF